VRSVLTAHSDNQRFGPHAPRPMKVIKLKPGKEKSLLRRHPWVFDGAIAKGGGDPGETVRIESAEGQFLAWGAVSPYLQNPRQGVEF
jgi:hypothetical protein